MVEVYLAVWEMGYFEVSEAFKGLSDEKVWKRPTEELLSVGELAGHIAYWEAVKFAGDGGGQRQPDPAQCRVNSPLIDRRFGYYPTTIATSPSEQHLAMTANQVCSELLRVHQEAVAYFTAQNPSLESTPPGWAPNYTYKFFLEYAAFHVAYHVGQMYSVRHLLGDETPDN